jgi:hypothetical protein
MPERGQRSARTVPGGDSTRRSHLALNAVIDWLVHPAHTGSPCWASSLRRRVACRLQAVDVSAEQIAADLVDDARPGRRWRRLARMSEEREPGSSAPPVSRHQRPNALISSVLPCRRVRARRSPADRPLGVAVDVSQVVRRLVVNGVSTVTRACLAAHQDMTTAAERVGVARFAYRLAHAWYPADPAGAAPS